MRMWRRWCNEAGCLKGKDQVDYAKFIRAFHAAGEDGGGGRRTPDGGRRGKGVEEGRKEGGGEGGLLVE